MTSSLVPPLLFAMTLWKAAIAAADVGETSSVGERGREGSREGRGRPLADLDGMGGWVLRLLSREVDASMLSRILESRVDRESTDMPSSEYSETCRLRNPDR